MDVEQLYRARFLTDLEDPRPMKFPPPHPWWCTGQDEFNSVVVAYVESSEQLLEYWPDAIEIQIGNPVSGYVFNDRFPRPEWF